MCGVAVVFNLKLKGFLAVLKEGGVCIGGDTVDCQNGSYYGS